MLARTAFLVLLFCRVSAACDAHPGLPHEQWMRWVDGLNAKYAAEQAAKKSPSESKSESTAARAPRAESRGTGASRTETGASRTEVGRAARSGAREEAQVRSLRTIAR